jgi:hypothetical protein
MPRTRTSRLSRTPVLTPRTLKLLAYFAHALCGESVTTAMGSTEVRWFRNAKAGDRDDRGFFVTVAIDSSGEAHVTISFWPGATDLEYRLIGYCTAHRIHWLRPEEDRSEAGADALVEYEGSRLRH